MIEGLKGHGYNIESGTLYPILNKMEKDGLLIKEDQLVNGKIREYYSITNLGDDIFKKAARQAAQLFHEIEDN
jgi:PadR family transcriptional regulator, regulatory protein PadR